MNRKINHDFRAAHPDVPLPPDYLLYESFRINYAKYYTDGIETAKWLIEYFRKHIDLKDRRILDWGCGPGRIIRHLPALLGDGCGYYGTDYNAESIDWCKKNLRGIKFSKNSLAPNLHYPDDFFDVIYGISILTHLSEQFHYGWFNELQRVLKPGGIMFLTTQGDNFKVKLTKCELKIFEEGRLVVRGKTKEGHRTFSAFQPKDFMERLFASVKILEHAEIKPGKGQWLPQDIWIIRKELHPTK
jgi:SAM-dependent methyltransferase